MAKDKWVPLQRANVFGPEPEHAVALTMERLKLTRAEAVAYLDKENDECEYWINDVYQVMLCCYMTGYGKTIQLNIRRRDGKVILRDWRVFQRIKNQLVGPEVEGVELYPAESRLVDTSNKFHIWCVVEPGFRFPFGFQERDVKDDEGHSAPGLKQRAFGGSSDDTREH